MKYFSLILISLLIISFIACNNRNQNDNKTNLKDAAKNQISPIEGNWILVSNEVYGRQIKPKRFPQQLKIFHDGYFSFVMYDSIGNFYYAGAGPYEINGNMYKETFAYSSDTSYNDSKDWQRWEIKGDTLIFYGFEKAELADGADVTKEWGGRNKFIEKRIKVTQP